MEDIAADDDLLSDMLLDSLEFEPPISTHKMNQSYRSPRYDTASVVDLVRKRIVCERDTPKALEELCDMSVVKKHLQGKSSRQSQAFVSHARRYLEAYLPDSGFEFAVTNRYKRSTAPLASSLADASAIAESSAAGAAANSQAKDAGSHSAKAGRGRRSGEVIAPLAAGSKADLCVVAVRDLAVGEIIPCKGGVKDLSKSEDEALRNEAAANRGRQDEKYGGVLGQGRDFSIIKSSMRNCSQLLLGPARFVNHDCNPSVQFYRSGQQMMFKVLRPIATNEEVLVAYGDHYFGWENSECLCATCETQGRGAFTKDGVQSLKDQEKNAANASTPDEEQPPGDGRRAPSKRIKAPADRISPATNAENSNGSAADTDSAGLYAPDSQYANIAKRKSSSRASSSNGKIKTVASDRELSDPLAALGPKCKCITCGGPFYAPEAWWLPEECTRCERHYRVYKADWPCRIPEEPFYADLYERAQKRRKINGGVGGEDGAVTTSGNHPRSKTKDGTVDATSPPLPKKRGRPRKNPAPPASDATPTPSLPSVSGSTHSDSPIRLSPLRQLEGHELEADAPRASRKASSGKNGRSDAARQPLPTKTATSGGPFSDSGSDLTEVSSLAATEALADQGAPSGFSSSSSSSSTSTATATATATTSGSDSKPVGPKMLGKEAKTEALAKFWGISESEGAKRLRKPSMNGPVSLAGKVGRPSAGFHQRSGSGMSAVSVFEADSDEDEQRAKQEKNGSRETKTSVGSSTPKAAGADGIKRSSRASSVAFSDAKSSSHAKASTSGDDSSARTPAVIRRDTIDDPLNSFDASGFPSPSAAQAPSGQSPTLATHGTARTSISNLAAFWSAGVDAGSRTRKQTHREPKLLVRSASSAVSSPKRGRESSESQPPSGGVSGEAKRQRGGGRRSRGSDDDISAEGDVTSRPKVNTVIPPSLDGGRVRTPPNHPASDAPSPATEGSASRPRSPLANPILPKDVTSTMSLASAAHSRSPVARPSPESSSTFKNGSPCEVHAYAAPGGGISPATVSAIGPATYRHIPGRKNLRIGRGASVSRPLSSSSSPGTNNVVVGAHTTNVLNAKEKQVQPVVSTTAGGWPGVSYPSAIAVASPPTAHNSPLARVTKVEDGDDGIGGVPWAGKVADNVAGKNEDCKMDISN